MGDTNILPSRVQNVLDMEIVRLNLWSINFNASNIKLEGYVRTDDGSMMRKVCSEIICKRMNSTMLFDVSGRFYELAGQIDKEYQLKMGMPSRVIDEFSNGFPENWAFLIKSCLSLPPRSTLRPIQDVPREPLRSRAEQPIVTLADETELVENERKNSDSERDKKRRDREEQRVRENEKRVEDQREKEHQEAIAAAAAEKKRKEEEESAADYTFRVPGTDLGNPITPIRFTRGGQLNGHIKSVFQQTPVRGKSSGPLASSTPQAPPPENPRRLSHLERASVPAAPLPEKDKTPAQRPVRSTDYASDSDLFAVPQLPPAKNIRPSVSSDSAFDFLDQMDSLFDSAVIEQTPGRDQKARKIAPPSPDARRRFSSREPERRSDYESSRYINRYNDDYNMSRMSRRDEPWNRRHDEGRDESRMSRKRGHFNSPPHDSDYGRRDNRGRRPEYYESNSKYDTKRYRPRETSSSSGRSVRFEDDYKRRDDFREPSYSRSYRMYDDRRGRESSRDLEDKNKLDAILRREKELVDRLENTSKPSSSRRHDLYSSDEDPIDLADEWDRENQEIMDNSMMFGDGISKKKRRSGAGRPQKKQPTGSTQPKPARKPAEPRKKARRSPPPADNLNDSIASNRPRRACVTPSTPAPKRITWPKRDLDKLKHVIELKKPTGSDADWAEVARLLAKEGVEAEVVKQAAITKLKWKEPVQIDNKEQEEEEEKKRRRGVAARVKEGVKMREELMSGKQEEDRALRVDSMEDYQPEDVAADQSLLTMGTPLAAKKKGGTRGSIMPKPVEDSPMSRGRNSTFNSPRLDQTKAKEVETTLKYVQHLSMMQGRPSSRANKSYLDKSSRGSKNTSLSLEQGARKALKIINRGTTIHEDDEDDDEEEDDDDEFEDQEVGDTSNY